MGNGELHTKAKKTVSIDPEEKIFKIREADTHLTPLDI